MATCRKCGAAIWFGVTEKGRRMPIDTKMAPPGKGNVTITENGDPPVVATVPVGQGKLISHFATCTDPDMFRKRG